MTGVDFGGLTVTVDTTLVRSGSVAVSFGGLRVAVAATDRPVAALFDADGTWLAPLPLAAGLAFQDELSAPGSVSLRLPLDDATTALATGRRIVKVWWRGAYRQAARIPSQSTDIAVDGRRWRDLSAMPGCLADFGQVLVYPEYGIDRSTSAQRYFGYMSKHGTWRDSGNWTYAEDGVTANDITGPRATLADNNVYIVTPNPEWIAKDGPYADEAVNAKQFFRRAFRTESAMTVQILATGDNKLTFWLDGEQIIAPDAQSGQTWRFLVQVLATLPAGEHVLAARVDNTRVGTGAANPMGFLFTMQRTAANGDVIAETPLVNSDFRWLVSDIYPGFRRAEVIQLLFREADDRNAANPNWPYSLGFNSDYDSLGVLWTDTPGEYALDVMSSLLDGIQQMCEKELDVWMDPDTLKLHAYNRRGADLSATVILDVGEDDGNLVSHSVDRVEPRFNVILVQKADGSFVEVADADSVAAYGRLESGASLGSTSDTGSAAKVAEGQFVENAWPSYTFTTQVSTLDGLQPYIDFNVGDSISVPDDDGSGYMKVRVMAITVDAGGDVVQVTPELLWDRGGETVGIVTNPDGSGDFDPGTYEPPAEGTVAGMITVPDPGSFTSDHPITNFSLQSGTTGLVPPKVLAGAGPTSTGYYLVPHSSTQAGKIPLSVNSKPNTNPLTVLVQGGNDSAHVVTGIDWSGFAVVGTDQDHYYNGVRIGYSNGAHLDDFFIGGIPGGDNFPPPETFGLNGWHADNALIENGVIDGRDQAGTPVAASLIGINSSTGVTVRQTTANYARWGIGFTGWKSSNLTVTDCDFSRNRRAMNFENCTGWIHLTRVDLTNQVSTSHHISLNSNLGSVVMVITDPVVEWPLRILAGPPSVPYYPPGSGKPNLQRRSDVHVIVSGVDVTSNPSYVHFV